MPTLTVRVSSVVVKEYTFEGVCFDNEDSYCEDAKDQMRDDLDSNGWEVSHSDVRVKWEGEEG